MQKNIRFKLMIGSKSEKTHRRFIVTNNREELQQKSSGEIWFFPHVL